MKQSKNPQVQQFLEEIEELDEKKFQILQKMREIVFSRYPKIDERIMYGGIMFSLEEDCGGLFVSKNHVSFEFGQGYRMKDPKQHLEGEGKFRRHLKIKSIDDIQDKEVEFFVKQLTI